MNKEIVLENDNKRIKFENLKFKIPEDARNDGGFDYRRHLKSRGIYHIASASVEDLKASGSEGFVVFSKINKK